MTLDQRGDIAIAIIIVYIILGICALVLTFRFGFKRKAGFFFLLLFSIVRIASGAALIIAENSSPPSSGAYTATFILQSAGAVPLLDCTTAFLSIVVSLENPRDESGIPFVSTRTFRLVHLGLTGALILSIIGGVESSNQGDSTGPTLRKVGAIALAICFCAVALMHLLVWGNLKAIFAHRRTLLVLCTFALPFLAVRVLYSILSAFAPFPQFNAGGVIVATGGLEDFSSIAGKWQIYLVMSVLMEFAVALIYIGGGLFLLKREDVHDNYVSAYGASDIPLQAQPPRR